MEGFFTGASQILNLIRCIAQVRRSGGFRCCSGLVDINSL